MRILGKSGNEVLILSTPSEKVHQGDYLQLEDTSKKINILAQIYEETYIDIPGLSEEILRDEVIGSTLEGIQGESLEIKNISMYIRDSRILKCKIRGIIKNSTLTYSNNLLPSRVYTKIKKISYDELFEIVKRKGKREIKLGTGASNETLKIYAEALDGKLNIITGKKESGKSHLSKLLAANLAELGAPIIIFDLNDEYKGLTKNKNGTTSNLSRKITRLVPGKSLKFNLEYLELNCLCNILTHSLQLPGASLREFIRIFKLLKTKNSLNIDELRNQIYNWKSNEFVRDALISRFHTLQSTGILTDNNESIKLEELLKNQPDGNIIIISLSEASPLVRKISVEIILSKLVNLLEKKEIKPVFLFAEEAHLYLRDTYWDDIVTRMRHFGIFTTFITNQPDAIDQGIYRQADNIFLFNFTNDTDIELVSKASMVDADTVKSIVRTLPSKNCLILGKTVNDLPVVVEISQSKWHAMGETKLFFN